MLKNLSVKLKIIYSFIGVICITVVLLIVLSSILMGLKQQVEGLFGIEYLVESDRDAYQSNLALAQVLSNGNVTDSATLKRSISDVEENLAQVLQRYEKFKAIYAQEVRLIEGFRIFESDYQELVKTTTLLIDYLKAGDVEQVRSEYFGSYIDVFNKTRGNLNNFTDITFATAINNNKTSSYFISNIVWFMSVIIIVLVSVFLWGGIYIANSISLPVMKMVKELSVSSSQIGIASTELSGSSQEIANGATEQASAIEQTTASMEELSSMVKQNVSNAREESILAEKMADVSQNGFKQMEDMLISINDINKSSDEIRNIIDVIEDIAFQTNMLALNAAVEAARAGEAGMGFAVVADEVKNLANRSAESAKETAKKIKESINKTETGLEIAKRLADTFKDILINTRKLTEMSKEVETASRQQDTGISEVNTALVQFDNVVQSNASSAEETASAAEELMSQVETLNEIVQNLFQLVTGTEYIETEKVEVKNKSTGAKKKNMVYLSGPMKKKENKVGNESELKSANRTVKQRKISFDDDEEFGPNEDIENL